MILITGASGQLGRQVAQLLIDAKVPNLAILARDASKVTELADQGVEVRIADYNDPESLRAAFQGVDKLYFVSSSDLQNRAQQHANVVAAAKDAGVGHILYTSFQRKSDSPDSPIALLAKQHLDTENLIKATGIPYTFLQHGFYMEFLPMLLGPQVVETGTIYYPSGEGKVAFVMRSDLAAVAAQLLQQGGHENKTYELTNAEGLTMAEIAAEISALTGKTIQHVSPTDEAYHQVLLDAGLVAPAAAMFAGFAKAFRLGEFGGTNDLIERFTGRKAVSIRDFLRTLYVTA